MKPTVSLVDLAVNPGVAATDLARMAEISGRDPDAPTGELPDHPAVRPGDVWALGGHKIVCGDCTDPMVVARLLDGERPNLMVTDPPYGVDYDPTKSQVAAFAPRVAGVVFNDIRSDWHAAWRLFPGNIAYIWHADRRARSVIESLESANFEIRAQIVWAKQAFVIGRGAYHYQHEPCYYAVRRSNNANWQGDRKQTTLWVIKNASVMGGDRGDGISGHGTQKPVECMRRPIINHTVPGDWVYDPFLGSGTTLVACEMGGRRCLGVEIDPRYIYLTIARWQFLTGRQATMGGEAFAEVAARRLKDPVGESATEVAFLQPDFDPALALWELHFCPPGGAVLDLDASATRAAVAATGRLHPAVATEPADLLLAHPRPPGGAAYGDFLGALLGDLRAAAARLREDRFAVLVAPEVEWADGLPCGFPVHLHQAACEVGLRFYGWTVYVGDERAHVMVFCKGDPKAAEVACGGVG